MVKSFCLFFLKKIEFFCFSTELNFFCFHRKLFLTHGFVESVGRLKVDMGLADGGVSRTIHLTACNRSLTARAAYSPRFRNLWSILHTTTVFVAPALLPSIGVVSVASSSDDRIAFRC